MQRQILFVMCGLALVGCDGGNVTSGSPGADTQSASEPAEVTGGMAAGKPTAPIDIGYDVIGTPIVGQPVSIDLSVRSTRGGDAPVRLRYKVLDTQAMSFPDTQARELALKVGGREPAVRQVTVVPQREGRLYLNVTAEVETPGGALIKSIAIPVQVGKGGPVDRKPGGTLKEDADGETVISLPADGA